MEKRKRSNKKTKNYRSSSDGKSYYTSRQKSKLRRHVKCGIAALVLLIVALIIIRIAKPEWFPGGKYREVSDEKITAEKPEIDVQLLTVNPYSRPQTESEKINAIVIHYTANPGATAMQNRDYFEGLKDSHITQASSHFIVGLEGEIIQCVPTWETAYASNSRNADTVSIECCHPDESGQFNEATYRSMVQLTAWLCQKFGLDSEDVIRHYDITGKNCPKYFVENEEAWEQFKEDVKTALETAAEEG